MKIPPLVRVELGRASGILGALLLLVGSCNFSASAQVKQTPPPAKQPAAETPKAEPSRDPLGRLSPRSTLMAFLAASRKGNSEVAALYLNTTLRGEPAQELARQLAVVLNQRLPARLNEVSDAPEGSISDPLRPDQEVIGTISTEAGEVNITLERADRGKGLGRVWLFSKQTLSSIPEVYREVNTVSVEKVLPEFLVTTRIAEIPLYEYVAIFLGLPFLYLLTGLLKRALGWLIDTIRHRLFKKPSAESSRFLTAPVRLSFIALTIHIVMSRIGLPFLARQFWSTIVWVICVVVATWLVLLLNGWCERRILDRLQRRNLGGAASILRLGRRVVDVAILFVGFLFILRHFGVNPTAALAGLGVGGIAVALAAQKTLENVIGGISLIADKAVRVGDALKLGDAFGIVEEVGLRSTRIRTLDRTVITVPNGQIATLSLETFSARDKFWLHHVIGLRYETSAEQMRAVTEGIRKLLLAHPNVEVASVRVRFIRLGAFSLDVELFAYVFAADWNQFLELQEGLLIQALEMVEAAGTDIAFPSRTMYLSADAGLLQGRLAALATRSDAKPGPTVAHAKSA